MDKKQKQIVITSILILVFIIAWVNVFNIIKKRSKKEVSTLSSASQALALRPKIDKEEKTIYPIIKDENLEWVRCPFSGKIYTSSKGTVIDLKLMGILWDEQDPRAIINNKVVGVGKRIGIYTVVEIKKNSVIINDGSRIFEVKLGR